MYKTKVFFAILLLLVELFDIYNTRMAAKRLPLLQR